MSAGFRYNAYGGWSNRNYYAEPRWQCNQLSDSASVFNNISKPQSITSTHNLVASRLNYSAPVSRNNNFANSLPAPVLQADAAHQKQSYLPWALGTCITGSLAIVGGLLWKRATKPSIKKPEKATIDTRPPLLKLEDLKIPPGLETPEKRLEKTVTLVNTVFPKLLYLIKHHPNDWEPRFTREFNLAFQQQIFPQGAVSLRFNTREDCNGFGTVGYHPVRMENIISDTDILSLKEKERPVYDVGGISIIDDPKVICQNETGRAKLYSTLLHEVSHVIYFIAQNLDQNSLEMLNATLTDKTVGYFLLNDCIELFKKFFESTTHDSKKNAASCDIFNKLKPKKFQQAEKIDLTDYNFLQYIGGESFAHSLIQSKLQQYGHAAVQFYVKAFFQNEGEAFKTCDAEVSPEQEKDLQFSAAEKNKFEEYYRIYALLFLDLHHFISKHYPDLLQENIPLYAPQYVKPKNQLGD